MLNAKDQFTACTCFQLVRVVLEKHFEKEEIKDMFKSRNVPHAEPTSDSISSNLLMTAFSNEARCRFP